MSLRVFSRRYVGRASLFARVWTVIALLTVVPFLSVTGCGKGGKDKVADAEATPEPPALEPEFHSNGSTDASSGDAATDEIPTQTPEQRAITEMVTDVADLMVRARQSEARLDFDAAVPIWIEIRDRVVSQYGPQSWQARNAELAIAAARSRAEMDFDQRRTLYELEDTDSQADAMTEAGRHIEALTLRAEACDLARSLWTADSHIVGVYLFKQAQSHQAIGQYPEAEGLMRQTMQLRERTMGRLHPEFAAVQHALAILYQQQSQLDLALQPMQESVDICGRTWGEQSSIYATYLNDLGVLQYARGEFGMAEQTLTIACSSYRDTSGEDSFEYAHAKFNLGNAQLSQQRLGDAQQSFEEALTIIVEQKNSDHELALQTRSKLGMVLLMQDDIGGAELHLKQVADARRRLLGHRHPEYAKSLFQWSITLGRQGKYDLVESALNEVFDVQQASLAPSHPDLVRTMETLAVVYRRTGRDERAAALESQVRVAQQNQAPPQYR